MVDPELQAAVRLQSKAKIYQIFRAMLRFCICQIFVLSLPGPYEHGTLLGREVLLGPRMTHDQKQNRLGNLKIWRTEGICSQQSFSQILPPLYQFIRVLEKKLVPASPGDSYHSYDWFIPFASQSKFLLSLEGT